MPYHGDLQVESPALYRSITKRFDAATVEQIVREYKDAAEKGGDREIDFSRPADASYNPRMARIVSIIASDAGLDSSDTIRAALWSCIPSNSNQCELPELPEGMVSGDQAHREKVRSAIFAATQLDRLRHIHLLGAEHLVTAKPQTEEGADGDSLTMQRRIVDEVSVQLERGDFSVADELIVAKLRHAVTTQRRRLDVLGAPRS